jgi:hypothetical protein
VASDSSMMYSEGNEFCSSPPLSYVACTDRIAGAGGDITATFSATEGNVVNYERRGNINASSVARDSLLTYSEGNEFCSCLLSYVAWTDHIVGAGEGITATFRGTKGNVVNYEHNDTYSLYHSCIGLLLSF